MGQSWEYSGTETILMSRNDIKLLFKRMYKTPEAVFTTALYFTEFVAPLATVFRFSVLESCLQHEKTG